ncbi:hypothetical protein [Salinicola halophilus]|uniref:hypothetical protein n=1 Tax=Salinicola halophilus TaxID=184065 RepID=UPI000DA264C5|nr:hypothetical protein [Salinicola halophilus]
MAEMIYFCISLKSRKNATDWDAVCALLSNTIDSIKNSTSKNYHIVIAGHEKPQFIEGDDAVTFVEAPFAPPGANTKGRGNDKHKKRRLAAAWVKSQGNHTNRLGYIDADDLIDKTLVEKVLSSGGDVSVIVNSGYKLDMRNGDMEFISKRFSRYCGSCFFPVFTNEELPSSWDDVNTVFSQFDKHREFDIQCKALGKKVKSVQSDDAGFVVYLVNHTDSLEFSKKGMKNDTVDNGPQAEVKQRVLETRFGLLDFHALFEESNG